MLELVVRVAFVVNEHQYNPGDVVSAGDESAVREHPMLRRHVVQRLKVGD